MEKLVVDLDLKVISETNRIIFQCFLLDKHLEEDRMVKRKSRSS